jgi:hypothetical protein
MDRHSACGWIYYGTFCSEGMDLIWAGGDVSRNFTCRKPLETDQGNPNPIVFLFFAAP